MQGQYSLRHKVDGFREHVPTKGPLTKRFVGLDLGTNCGVAMLDYQIDNHDGPHLMVAGIWDLSIGPYDTGPLRFVRLQQFLVMADPDFLTLEDVKHTPEAGLSKMGINAVLARASTAAEFLGSLKNCVASWAEIHNIPMHCFGIGEIKKWATGKGNSGKAPMINAANEQFGLDLNADEDVYKNSGDDNVADAAFVCAMGVEHYGQGV